MPVAPAELFRALGNPTRRAIFERLVSEREQTVRALTEHADYQGAAYGWQKFLDGLERVTAVLD